MKDHRILTRKEELAAEDELFGALLNLSDVAEYRAFFQDLCTPAELQAMKDRWSVVELLADGLPYRTIHDQTGVSVTTIGRVARCLTEGAGGYRTALERLGKKMTQS
jgi:TrpR-related protein YerC/YecD